MPRIDDGPSSPAPNGDANPTALTPEQWAAAALAAEREGWWTLWQGMPEFLQRDLEPWKQITVAFENRAALEDFSRRIGQKVLPTARSIWHPKAEIGKLVDKRYVGNPRREPRWPIYVPTKGRWESLLTISTFQRMGQPFRAVVEAQELDAYRERIDPALGTILVLPFRDRGLVAARNWIWDHAAAEGWRKFWTFDDNIDGIFRLNRNLKTPVADPTPLAVMEDFVDRFENVPVAGMNYFMFASRKTRVPPLYLNTRVYSNMLIDTFAKDPSGQAYRNRDFYNDDTDLCLRMLKDGWCTILFNAFLIMKQTTMTVKGGLTPHYQGDGRLKMAESLVRQHPDVAKVTWKWGRWQHHVDYRPFATNKLVPRPGLEAPRGFDDGGLILQDLVDGVWVSRDETKLDAVRRAALEALAKAGGVPQTAAAPAVLDGDELESDGSVLAAQLSSALPRPAPVRAALPAPRAERPAAAEGDEL